MKQYLMSPSLWAVAAMASLLTACGGGGGGGGSAPVITYPYQTVYGQACASSEPTPGCTFNTNGTRIKVTQDPTYNVFGQGSNDLWYVKFDAAGNGAVYNNLGVYQYTSDVSKFAGYISGNTIGVGTTGLYWENISGGTYWLGKNGVLYSANTGETQYGQAINNKTASHATDTNFSAIASESNKTLIKAGAAKLVSDYGFKQDKAMAVASALNSWAISSASRGYTTDKDMDTTFKAVFGVEFSSALSAVKDLQAGNKAGMVDLTNRSAAALGLDPHDAQKFIKGMYSKALSSWGYDANSINW